MGNGEVGGKKVMGGNVKVGDIGGWLEEVWMV